MESPIHLFTDTVKLIRPTLGTDTGGFPTQSSFSLVGEITGRISLDDSSEEVRAGGQRRVQAFRFYTTSGQDIRATDRVWWNGGQYEITEQTERHTPFVPGNNVLSNYDAQWIEDTSEPM